VFEDIHDSVKMTITKAVHDGVVYQLNGRPYIKITSISDLITDISVPTPNGLRHFSVEVTENLR
jgi:hypothetical protein